MFFVYRFLNIDGDVIYVGKSKQPLEARLRGHRHLPTECYQLVHTIEYIECETEADMSIKEIYYINKYRHNKVFFNVLDVSAVPQSVHFDDHWSVYSGPVYEGFSNSQNIIKNKKRKKTKRLNKDGSIDKRVSHAKPGVPIWVDSFTADEADKIAKSMMIEVCNANTAPRKQILFRNVIMFVIGCNLPVRPNDIITLRYRDVFDEQDNVKPYQTRLNREYKDEILTIPFPENVKTLLTVYQQKYGLSYQNNSEDFLFESQKHGTMTTSSYNRIITDSANKVGITKNLGGESLRKTYGLNIYNKTENKLEAIVFLEYLWGQTRYGSMFQFLGLYTDELRVKKFFQRKYALCRIDKKVLQKMVDSI